MLAAAATETNTDPAPSDITRNPGSTSVNVRPVQRYARQVDPGRRYQAALPPPRGGCRMRVISCEAMPPATTKPAVMGRYAAPALSGE